MTHKLGRLPDTSAQSIMKREFGFTQKRFVQLVISVCHANAKHPKSRPTEAPRSHSCHPQFLRVLGNSDRAAVSPRPNDGHAIMSCSWETATWLV